MSKITKEQYDFAMERVEELLPLVDDNTPANGSGAYRAFSGRKRYDAKTACQRNWYQSLPYKRLYIGPFGTDAANCKASLPHIEYTTLCHAWHLST